MKKVHIVLAGMTALSVTATVVAAQNGGLERTIDAVQDALGFEASAAFDVGAAQESRAASDFRWAGRVDRGDAIEIKGVNGEIVVERATGRDVVVTAETRARRSDPSSVTIERIEHASGVTLCALYPSPNDRRENYCAPGSDGRMNTQNNDVRVDFRIEVPAGVDFVGRTVNGGIEVFDLDSDVVAITVNGDIEISTSGQATAETVNGSIEAAMGALELRSDIEFSTVNGSITLDLEEGVDADLDASWLNGSFESDLPFTMEGRVSRRSARGVIGDGGPELELNTVNGSIRIR